jgi:hypothetical protein
LPELKQNVCNAINKIPTQHLNWLNNMISCIKQVLGTPCNTPSAPEFRFKLLEEAAKQNLEVLRKYNYDLGQALKAQKDSPLAQARNLSPRTSFDKSLVFSSFGITWKPSSVMAANGH